MSINWPRQMYIGGKWTPARSGKTLPAVNPANGEQLTEVALANADDVDRAVAAARQAFDQGPWPRMDPLERGRYLWRIAEGIRKRADDLAMTDTLNMGKPGFLRAPCHSSKLRALFMWKSCSRIPAWPCPA